MRKKFRSLPEDGSLDEPLINLTPLIDVVFVVLITFMLIAPVLDIDSVDLATSGSQKNTAPFENGPLTIAVHADNTIWFQGKAISLSQLENRMREEKKKYPKAIPQVIHDSRAQFGTYQSLKNILELAGFEQMDVILKPN
ncbi:MAG TPA: biopolymer transporter ExbD [Chlamydiales bacterium]|nr:biopolymer transporter ExbD [Chlamydiales bacterium]